MKYDLILPTKKLTVGKNTCEILVLHHTAGGNFKSNMSFLATSNKQASAHYVVGTNGECGKIGEDGNILWHAGTSSWNGKTDLNKYSIGIEIVGPGFSDIQRDKVDELVLELIKKHNIKKENLVRHKDIAPGRKVDPHDSLWNTRFKTFEAYKNFLFSKLTIMEAVGFYEEIYKKENPNGGSVIKDIDGAINRLVDTNGNLKGKETIYFFGVIAERGFGKK